MVGAATTSSCRTHERVFRSWEAPCFRDMRKNSATRRPVCIAIKSAMLMSPYIKSLITSTQVGCSILQLKTPRALYQGYQLVANMASHSKQHVRSEKFGDLPLSTSGPQKTTLTVSSACSEGHPSPLTLISREMHSLEPHTSTKELPSQQKNVQRSNYTDSYPTTSKLLTNRFDAPMNSTSHAPATLRRTRS